MACVLDSDIETLLQSGECLDESPQDGPVRNLMLDSRGDDDDSYWEDWRSPFAPFASKTAKAMLVAAWCGSFALGGLLANLRERFLLADEPEPEAVSRQTWEMQPDAWAYVTMAIDDDTSGISSQRSLWHAVAWAKSLQRFTMHRIILLTDYETFADGTSVVEAFRELNTEVRPTAAAQHRDWDQLPFDKKKTLCRLGAWSLHGIEKAVWLDVDGLAYRSLDWLFEREGMWGGRHSWDCALDQPYLNIGVFSFTPDEDDAQAMLQRARKNPDQAADMVLVHHFQEKRQSIQLVSDFASTFGKCLNEGPPTPYLSPLGEEGDRTLGLFNVAAYVQQSGGYGRWHGDPHNNVCFDTDVQAQQFSVGNAILNVCQFHPLGAEWRSLFCDGVRAIAVHSAPILAFCSDACYHLGQDEPGVHCPWEKVDSTPWFRDYYERLRGVPVR